MTGSVQERKGEPMLIENKNVGISIGTMSMKPIRKKPCLVVQIGNTATKVASFNNDEAAVWFMEKFRQFMELPELYNGGEPG